MTARPGDLAPSDSVTIIEAAALARVTRRTIYYWLDSKKLRWYRTVGGGIRIVRASLFSPEIVDSEPVAPKTRK